MGLLLTGLSIAALPTILIYVLVLAIFIAALYWIINKFFPEPMRGYAIGVVIVIAAIIVIYFLLSLVGAPALGH